MSVAEAADAVTVQSTNDVRKPSGREQLTGFEPYSEIQEIKWQILATTAAKCLQKGKGS